MAALAIGDVYNVEWWCRCLGQYALNVKSYRVTNLLGFGLVHDYEVLASLNSAARNVYRPAISNLAEWYGTSVYRTHPSATLPLSFVDIISGTGGVGVLPPQLSGFIRFRTDSIGRRNNSCLHVPFAPSGADNGQGRPTGAYTTALNAVRTMVLGPRFIVGFAGIAVLTLVTRTSPASAGRVLTRGIVTDLFGTVRTRSFRHPNDPPPFS